MRDLPSGRAAIPAGSFLAARAPAAVCTGNTETTQPIADTVLKVFPQFAPDRAPAASRGTMNPIGIGRRAPRNGRPYTNIETIGGARAGGRCVLGRMGSNAT